MYDSYKCHDKHDKISDLGILLKVFKLAHSKVPMATIIISPVRAAIGKTSIRPAQT
jgi:hypothetical protein